MDLLYVKQREVRTNEPCVVCRSKMPVIRGDGRRRSCGDILYNVSVGQFLVKLGVVARERVSLHSPLCDVCHFIVAAADKAWSTIDDAVAMLKDRATPNGDGAGPQTSHAVDRVETDDGQEESMVPNKSLVVEGTRARRTLGQGSSTTVASRQPDKDKAKAKVKGPHTVAGPRSRSRVAACGVCGKKFTRPDHARRHERLVHKLADVASGGPATPAVPRPKKLPCRYCSRAFQSKESRRKHETNVHIGGKTASSAVVNGRRVAEKRATGGVAGRVVKCRLCGLALRKNLLQRHIEREHAAGFKKQPLKDSSGGRTSSPGKHVCSICGSGYHWPHGLKRHLRDKHQCLSGKDASAKGFAASPSKQQSKDVGEPSTSHRVEDISGGASSPALSMSSLDGDRDMVPRYMCPVCETRLYTSFALSDHCIREHKLELSGEDLEACASSMPEVANSSSASA